MNQKNITWQGSFDEKGILLKLPKQIMVTFSFWKECYTNVLREGIYQQCMTIIEMLVSQ